MHEPSRNHPWGNIPELACWGHQHLCHNQEDAITTPGSNSHHVSPVQGSRGSCHGCRLQKHRGSPVTWRPESHPRKHAWLAEVCSERMDDSPQIMHSKFGSPVEVCGRLDITGSLRDVFSAFQALQGQAGRRLKDEAQEPGYHVHGPFPCLQTHSNQMWSTHELGEKAKVYAGQWPPTPFPRSDCAGFAGPYAHSRKLNQSSRVLLH